MRWATPSCHNIDPFTQVVANNLHVDGGVAFPIDVVYFIIMGSSDQ